jgi:hypothetical protein
MVPRNDIIAQQRNGRIWIWRISSQSGRILAEVGAIHRTWSGGVDAK